jgi:hypothetical protein
MRQHQRLQLIRTISIKLVEEAQPYRLGLFLFVLAAYNNNAGMESSLKLGTQRMLVFSALYR